MPWDKSKYPSNWKAISQRIRVERAEGRCECTGQCGKHVGRCEALNGQPHPVTQSTVVLTVAHYPDPTPGNVSDDNLLGTCQRCHNLIDQPMRRRNAQTTRLKKKMEEGQLPIPMTRGLIE